MQITEGYQTVQTPLVGADIEESSVVVNAAPIGTVFLEGDSSYEGRGVFRVVDANHILQSSLPITSRVDDQ